MRALVADHDEELRAHFERTPGDAPSSEQVQRSRAGDKEVLTREELRAIAGIRILEDD